MSVAFEYAESRWDHLARHGYAGAKDGRKWENCVICGRPVFLDKRHAQLEINWADNQAFDPATDPPEHSQGSFAVGAGCVARNPQLKRLVVWVDGWHGLSKEDFNG